MAEELSSGCEELFVNVYERILEQAIGTKLKAEEKQLFLNVGRNLLSGDLDFQQESTGQLSGRINKRIDELTAECGRQKKAVMISCLSASALTAILLL